MRLSVNESIISWNITRTWYLHEDVSCYNIIIQPINILDKTMNIKNHETCILSLHPKSTLDEQDWVTKILVEENLSSETYETYTMFDWRKEKKILKKYFVYIWFYHPSSLHWLLKVSKNNLGKRDNKHLKKKISRLIKFRNHF